MGAALAIDYDYFRTYSRATQGGGAVIKSTSAGGAVVKSTSSGGAVVKSTSSGGGTTATSSSGGGVAKSTASGGGSVRSTTGKTFGQIGMTTQPVTQSSFEGHTHSLYIDGTLWDHSHDVTIPAHTHNFDVPNHTHSVTIKDHTHEINIPAHQHEIDIPSHKHDITLPDHTHEIQHGIFKLNRTPSKVTIKVDGNTVPITATSGDSIDLIPYLALDSERRVQRGWHTVEITPNDLGRINAQLMVQFFMQSRGGVDA